MTTLPPPTSRTPLHRLDVSGPPADQRSSNPRLLLFGGLSGVGGTLAYFAGAPFDWNKDIPVEAPAWETTLTFWMTLAVAPFGIGLAYALYRLIAAERGGALNQLGFVFAVVAFSVLAVTQSFQLAVPLVLTDEMKTDGSDPAAWERIFAGLNAVDLGTDLAWDLFLGAWMLCIGVAMLRHSRLGWRWGVPALALVPPFFALNIATTPDPPHVDLGPLTGLYFLALSIWLIWLGAHSGEAVRTDKVTEKAAARLREGGAS